MVNYPNGKKFTNFQNNRHRSPTHYSKRGMNLEQAINDSNTWYLNHNIAVIHKKPTPIQIVDVDYPKRSRAVIREAYFRQPSTTDYNGIYKKYYLDFEAKQTNQKTVFPLANIHSHQIEHMKKCSAHGGIVFFIFFFKKLNQYFLLSIEEFLEFKKTNSLSKSIPLKFIMKKGIEVFESGYPRIDYLKGVDDLINKFELFQEENT